MQLENIQEESASVLGMHRLFFPSASYSPYRTSRDDLKFKEDVHRFHASMGPFHIRTWKPSSCLLRGDHNPTRHPGGPWSESRERASSKGPEFSPESRLCATLQAPWICSMSGHQGGAATVVTKEELLLAFHRGGSQNGFTHPAEGRTVPAAEFLCLHCGKHGSAETLLFSPGRPLS